MVHKLLARITLIVLLLALVLPGGLALAQEGGQVDLTETYVSADKSLTFNYPAEWVTSEEFPGYVLLASDEAALESWTGDSEELLAEEAVVLGIFPPQALRMIVEDYPPESLEAAWEAMTTVDDSMTYEEPEKVTIGGHSAMQGGMAVEEESEGAAAVIEFDGNYVVVMANSAQGAYANHADTVAAILETLAYEYTAPTGPQTFTTEDKTLSLVYPPDWLALDMMGTVAVTNNFNLFSTDTEVPVEPGTIYVFIFRPGVRETETTTLADAVKEYADSTLQGEEQKLQEPVEAKLGDYSAVRLDYQTELGEGYLLAVDVEGQNMYIQVYTAAGELASIEDVVQPILDSIQCTPE